MMDKKIARNCATCTHTHMTYTLKDNLDDNFRGDVKYMRDLNIYLNV